MKKIITLLILMIAFGNTVMTEEQVSNQAESNKIEVDETVGIGFSWSIPSQLNFIDG